MNVDNKIIRQLIQRNLINVKVSFEDEGADFIDVLFMKSFCDKNDIPLVLKLGGAEAIRDIKDANKLQIKKIVAPMIESSFALEKFVKSVDKYYVVEDGSICVNIESKQAYKNIEEMFSSKYINKLSSVTVGRGDLVQSYNMDRYNGAVDSLEIFGITKHIFELAKDKNLSCALGGSMTVSSKDFIERLVQSELLDVFETRNVMINVDALTYFDFDEMIEAALDFELKYLKFKSLYYDKLISHDKNRIKRLSKNEIK